MPITESRLKAGTLTFDVSGTPVSFATQATNVRLTPAKEDGEDRLEVLSGDVKEGDATTTWVMAVKAIQDFTDPAGFVAFALTNDGELAEYEWAPAGAGEVAYAGSCTVQAVEIGGDVNARLETEAEWPCTGAPTPTYPA
jgi:hypothetical protein